MRKYKFEKTTCSQCGRSFGPGDSGYSHCEDHAQVKIKFWYTDGDGVPCQTISDKMTLRNAKQIYNSGELSLPMIVSA